MDQMQKNQKNGLSTTEGKSISILIADLRAYLQLSQAAFAEPLGLSPTHIARFEKGISIPSSATIETICRAYQVDPEYFAKEGMELTSAVTRQNPEAGIAGRLASARKAYGWTQKTLSEKSGVDRTVINRVESGAKLTEKQAVRLAETLEVGVEWLLLGDEKRKGYPVDQKMISWLWGNEDARREIWIRMKESEQKQT